MGETIKRHFWGIVNELDDLFNHTQIRVPNPVYYWRRWRRG